MKVTPEMLHPELRQSGAVLKRMFQIRDERMLCRMGRISHVNLPVTPGSLSRGLCFEKLILPRREFIPHDAASERAPFRALVVSPAAVERGTRMPCVLWLHGGGYAMGSPEIDIHFAAKLIRAHPCVVVLPDYTLSFEAPFPAAVNDAYACLEYISGNAAFLHTDGRIVVAGDSAGGGLCCALTLLARDRGDVNIDFQMPLYPMLDDRMQTNSMRDNDAPAWDAHKNELAWKLYTGAAFGTDEMSKYAAPARETDFSGLPKAYSFVGTIEPFYDEARAYFANLNAAGVHAVLDEYEGCYHAFDLHPTAKVSERAVEGFVRAFAAFCGAGNE